MRNILLVSLLWILSACSPRSTHDKLVEMIKNTRSWTATAQMVGETWEQEKIPDRYAQETLTKSEEEITKETKKLSQHPVLLDRILETIQNMTAEVQKNDKVELVTSLQKLTTQQKQLDLLAKKEGAQP